MECFTGSGGRSRLGASRRPFGDGSCYRHSQPSTPNPYGVLAFDEFTDEAKSLRCLSYLTNRILQDPPGAFFGMEIGAMPSAAKRRKSARVPAMTINPSNASLNSAKSSWGL